MKTEARGTAAAAGMWSAGEGISVVNEVLAVPPGFLGMCGALCVCLLSVCLYVCLSVSCPPVYLSLSVCCSSVSLSVCLFLVCLRVYISFNSLSN